MATNEVEIELKLTGAEEAVEGFQEIGETSKAMAERFTNDNDKLGEGLGDLTGNVQGVIGSVKGLSTALSTSGQGFMALIGPIGAVVAAGYALYETFLNISGAAQEAEDRTEAMAAAAGDLQSKLEALAEKGVVLTTEELRRFSRATLQAQLAKESVQKRIEKLTPKYTELTEAQEGLTRAQKTYEEGNIGDVFLQSIGWTDDLTESRQRLVKANQALNQSLDKILPTQIEANKKISEAAKLEKEAEEQSDESRLARIKENQTRLDTIKLLQAETKLTEEQAKVLDVQQKTKRALLELDLERNKENAQYLKDLDERLKREVKTLEASNKARSIITARGEKEVEDIRQAAREKQKAEEEKARAQRQARRRAANAKAMAMARQRQAEESQIRALGYEKLRLDGVDQLELLELQYKDSLKLAGDNANKKLIVEMAYQNSLQKLQQEQEAKDKQKRQEQARLEAEQQRTLAEQRQAFIQSTMEFEANRIENETARELKLLELRYNEEIRLNEYTQDQITEIQRQQTIEREEILNASFNRSIDKLKDMGEELAASSLGAVYQSIINAGQYDLQLEELKYQLEEDLTKKRQELIEAQRVNDVESVRQREQEITDITNTFEDERRKIRAEESQAIPMAFGNILKGLGEQAAIEAMMETARGIATSFTMPALSANHFAAAGVFAAAAIAAGGAGASITNKASGAIAKAGRGSGGSAGLSPTGTPQTAPTPQREQADTQAIVFNINFGGAVIYDTQRAAEQALADRITNLQNTRRRGAPRRSM